MLDSEDGSSRSDSDALRIVQAAVEQRLRDLADRSDTLDANELFSTMRSELHGYARSLMARERIGHTLQATALVNEAFIRLQNSSFETRTAFLSLAATAMRHALIDHARAQAAKKRWGGMERVTLSDDIAQELHGRSDPLDLIALDEAMQELREQDPEGESVVMLRVYVRLGDEAIARTLGIPPSRVGQLWKHAKAWLAKRLGDGPH